MQGREVCPTTGRQHIQCYIQFKHAKSFSQLKKEMPKSHIEVAQGSATQNRAYCIKDGDWVEAGDIPHQGKRKDLDVMYDMARQRKSWSDVVCEVGAQAYRNKKMYHEMLADLQAAENKEKEIIILVGPTGCGKTRWAHDTYGESLYVAFDLKWWDGYDSQETVLIDDFNGQGAITWLLRLCDRYPMRVQIKGGTTPWLPKRIIFTSNVAYNEWFQDAIPAHRDAFTRRVTRVLNFWDGFEWNQGSSPHESPYVAPGVEPTQSLLPPPF